MAKGELTPEHLEQIDSGIAAAEEGIAFCDKCERADLPMAEQKRTLVQQRDQLRKVRAVFFPGQPAAANSDQ